MIKITPSSYFMVARCSDYEFTPLQVSSSYTEAIEAFETLNTHSVSAKGLIALYIVVPHVTENTFNPVNMRVLLIMSSDSQ